jgi:hypothetical protein
MHIHNFRFLFVLSIVSLTLTVAPACATTITTYTTLASWTAAANEAHLIDFENGSLTAFGVSFTGLSGTLGVIDTTGTSWMDFGTHKAAYINTNSAPTPTIHIALPASVTAFGLYLFSANPNALTFTVTTLSTTFNPTTNATPTPAFFGATSNTPFDFIDITLAGAPAGAYELIDNVRFGTSQIDQTPEAATFLLIGSGLVGLMALRKRIMRPGRKTHGLIYKNRAMNNIVST